MLSSGVWLLVLLAPVTKALAVGASMALLTHGPLFRRISGMLGWWPWPETRPHVAASLSLAVLVAASASAVLAVLWAAFGGLQMTVMALWGVAIHDQARITQVVELLTARAGDVLKLYPQVPVSVEQVRAGLTDFLQQTAVGSAFLNTVIAGGGGVVIELILTAVVIWWLYVQGPTLGHRLLSLLPASERDPIATRLRERAGALVLGSFGNAFVVGVYLGCAAWLIGGFQPVLVAAVAIIVGVMPLLGPVFVWLPLASLLAGQGRWEAAFALAAVSQCGALALEWLLARRTAAAPIAGTGPILLLTLVGGLWGFGLRGLVLAPAAVVLALSAWDALTSLYAEPEMVRDAESPVGHA
jgi:predicted PurR-regulated permease PerM